MAFFNTCAATFVFLPPSTHSFATIYVTTSQKARPKLLVPSGKPSSSVLLIVLSICLQGAEIEGGRIKVNLGDQSKRMEQPGNSVSHVTHQY